LEVYSCVYLFLWNAPPFFSRLSCQFRLFFFFLFPRVGKKLLPQCVFFLLPNVSPLPPFLWFFWLNWSFFFLPLFRTCIFRILGDFLSAQVPLVLNCANFSPHPPFLNFLIVGGPPCVIGCPFLPKAGSSQLHFAPPSLFFFSKMPVPKMKPGDPLLVHPGLHIFPPAGSKGVSAAAMSRHRLILVVEPCDCSYCVSCCALF